MGELLRRRRGFPRVSGCSRRRPRRTAAFAYRGGTRSGSTSKRRSGPQSPSSDARDEDVSRGVRSRRALAASASAAPPTTKTPGVLTVGLAMPAAGFQVGPSAGVTSSWPRGSRSTSREILARRLGIQRVRFLNERFFSTLLTPGAKDWDLALAEISVTPGGRKRVDFSRPYLTADQGVSATTWSGDQAGVRSPLCALSSCAPSEPRPARRFSSRGSSRRSDPLLLNDPSDLSYALFTKRCDAIVADAPALAVLRQQALELDTAHSSGASSRGRRTRSRTRRAVSCAPPIDAVLRQLSADGTLAQLRRRWLGVDTATLPALR